MGFLSALLFSVKAEAEAAAATARRQFLRAIFLLSLSEAATPAQPFSRSIRNYAGKKERRRRRNRFSMMIPSSSAAATAGSRLSFSRLGHYIRLRRPPRAAAAVVIASNSDGARVHFRRRSHRCSSGNVRDLPRHFSSSPFCSSSSSVAAAAAVVPNIKRVSQRRPASSLASPSPNGKAVF